MVCSQKKIFLFIIFTKYIYILGDVREKLRLAFDMYDMNKNGKVNKIIIIYFNRNMTLIIKWMS